MLIWELNVPCHMCSLYCPHVTLTGKEVVPLPCPFLAAVATPAPLDPVHTAAQHGERLVPPTRERREPGQPLTFAFSLSFQVTDFLLLSPERPEAACPHLPGSCEWPAAQRTLVVQQGQSERAAAHTLLRETPGSTLEKSLPSPTSPSPLQSLLLR